MSQLSEFIRKTFKLPPDMNSLADVKKKLAEEAREHQDEWAEKLNEEFDAPLLNEDQEGKLFAFAVDKVLDLVFGPD